MKNLINGVIIILLCFFSVAFLAKGIIDFSPHMYMIGAACFGCLLLYIDYLSNIRDKFNHVRRCK